MYYENQEETNYPEDPAPFEVIGFCDHCGENLFSDEGIWQIGDQVYCTKCIEELELV